MDDLYPVRQKRFGGLGALPILLALLATLLSTGAVGAASGATIVRGVLLPASMQLLGDWNWYLPKPLRWLPRFQIEAAPRTVVETSGD